MKSKLVKIIRINRQQRGFTLVEVLIAVAITGLIVGGVTMAIISLFGGHAQSSGEMVALRNVQNVGYQISRDAKMAEQIDINDEPGTPDVTEVLTILWTEIVSWKDDPIFDGEEIVGYVSLVIRHKVVYTWDDGVIERSGYQTQVIREDEDSYTYTLNTKTKVAEYIKSEDGDIGFEFNTSNNVLTVTATIGGFKSQTETRTYEVEPRTDTVFWQ